jgi:hypothetical protein
MAEQSGLPRASEYETIEITNPTKEDFSCRFNGEMYSLHAGASRSYPRFLAFHIAKHLSNRMLQGEMDKLQKKHGETNPFVPQIGILMNHDNPQRRAVLFDIFGSKEGVESCLAQLQFKSFVGDMSEYDAYVSKKTKKSEPAAPGSFEPEKKESQ